MRTIKPFDVDAKRVEASKRIYEMFGRVPFLYVKYKNTYAEGYCEYTDGLRISFTVWYRDLIVSTSISEPISQHDKAMAYISSIPERPWAS
ncbi:MAG: hypothetical protein IJY59_10105 [Bacteroidaceae bacterium]|nr:hypothetical protein [Bacteroidaceae bacterium]